MSTSDLWHTFQWTRGCNSLWNYHCCKGSTGSYTNKCFCLIDAVWFCTLNSRWLCNRFSTFLIHRILLDIKKKKKNSAKQPPNLLSPPVIQRLKFTVHLTTYRRNSSSSLMSSLKQWAGEFSAHQLQRLPWPLWTSSHLPHGSNKAQRFSIKTKSQWTKPFQCPKSAYWCLSSSLFPLFSDDALCYTISSFLLPAYPIHLRCLWRCVEVFSACKGLSYL